MFFSLPKNSFSFMRKLINLLFLLLFIGNSYAYNPKDSIRIESILASAQLMNSQDNMMLYFGKQFIGTPYVAHTLDLNKEEKLVINTRELDCTTFVENVLALTLCAQRGQKSFKDFRIMLQKIRYRNGKIAYTSRLHYFTEWIESNLKNGFVKKIESEKAPFTKVQNLNINYMSTHSNSYAMLKAHPQWLPEIKNMEKRLTGCSYRYIPKTAINNSKLLRETIKNGDIIAILTNKQGLDTSHIGIASWQKDGLHLLNASQIHKKVIEEPMLFQTYMSKHPSQIGIRVCRVAELKKK